MKYLFTVTSFLFISFLTQSQSKIISIENIDELIGKKLFSLRDSIKVGNEILLNGGGYLLHSLDSGKINFKITYWNTLKWTFRIFMLSRKLNNFFPINSSIFWIEIILLWL